MVGAGVDLELDTAHAGMNGSVYPEKDGVITLVWWQWHWGSWRLGRISGIGFVD